MHDTATTMVAIFPPLDVGSAPNKRIKPAMISLLQDRNSKKKTVATAPPRLKGLRFPHRILELSLNIPTRGCTKVPVSGPATQARDRWDLLRPSESR